jgi:hypothetical protein
VGQRDRKQVFTWIGLAVNGLVVLGTLGLFILGLMAD